MALVSCNNCGRRVSTTAPQCPGCGSPGPAAVSSSTPAVNRGTAKAARVFCTKCGGAMPSTGTTCPACGAERYRPEQLPEASERPQIHVAAPKQLHMKSYSDAALPSHNAAWPIMAGGIFAAVFVIIVGLLPIFIGYNAEAQYRQTVAELADDGIPITLNSYECGWFSSTATTDLWLDGHRFGLVHRIRHGPFVAHAGLASFLPVIEVIDTSIELPDNVDPSARELLKKLSLSIESSVTLAGAVDNQVYMAPVSYRDERDGSTLVSNGMTADFYVSRNVRELSGAFEGVSVTAPGGHGHASVGGLAFQGRSYRGSTGIWLGNLVLRIRELSAMGDTSLGETSLNDISFATSAGLKQGALDFTWQLAANRARFQGSALGPTKIDLELSKIDPDSIVRYISQYEAISHSGSPERAQLLRQKVIELLAALLKRSPKLSLNSRISLAEGEAQAAAEATIDDAVSGDPLLAPGSVNNAALVQSLFTRYSSASGVLNLPVSLVMRLANDNNRRQLAELGVLAPKGDRYVCNFNYSDGEFTVNGRKLTAADLAAHPLDFATGAADKAKRVQAQADLAEIKTALDRYYLDNGYYPSTDQGLSALVTPPTNGRVPANYESGGYIERLPMDPWGTPYFYQSYGNSYVLKSFGPDGVESADDIDASQSS